MAELYDMHRHLEASIPAEDISKASGIFGIKSLMKDGVPFSASEISDLVVMKPEEAGWDPFYDTVVESRKAFVSYDAITYLTFAAFMQAAAETKRFEMRFSPLSLIEYYLANTGNKAETEEEYKKVAKGILDAVIDGKILAHQFLPEHLFGLRFGISRTQRGNSLQKLEWLTELFETEDYSDENGSFFTGIDVLGLEVEGDLRALAPYIQSLREYLPDLAIHAGEIVGAQGIYDALELNPNAIGHGIAAANDPALMRELARRGIYVENCPTSNARVIPVPLGKYAEHPLKTLTDYRDEDGNRIKIVMGTDDPVSFGLTITQEYEAARLIGADIEFINKCAKERLDALIR